MMSFSTTTTGGNDPDNAFDTSTNRRNAIPKTDLEMTVQEDLDENGETIHGVLTNILTESTELLNRLEDSNSSSPTLGPTIRQYALDMADLVGNVARDLGDGDADGRENRRLLAQAALEDAKSQLLLEKEEQVNKQKGMSSSSPSSAPEESTPALTSKSRSSPSAAHAVSNLSESDVMDAISAAQSILFDIEDSLRSISEEDAEEIAQVGMVVSRMFLMSLQSVLDDVAEEDEDTLDIQIIDDDENENDSSEKQKQRSKIKKQKRQRMRILWPPIGQAVASTASWGQNAAIKQPILSIAIAMALWPALLITVFFAPSILLTDWALQSTYDVLEKEQPDIVEKVEEGAANLYNVGKLYFLVSKLVLKKSLRVGKLQLERKGGVGKVAQEIGSWAVDRIVHPVETAGMAIDGAKWSFGALKDSAMFVKDVATGEVKMGPTTGIGVDGDVPINML